MYVYQYGEHVLDLPLTDWGYTAFLKEALSGGCKSDLKRVSCKLLVSDKMHLAHKSLTYDK